MKVRRVLRILSENSRFDQNPTRRSAGKYRKSLFRIPENSGDPPPLTRSGAARWQKKIDTGAPPSRSKDSKRPAIGNMRGVAGRQDRRARLYYRDPPSTNSYTPALRPFRSRRCLSRSATAFRPSLTAIPTVPVQLGFTPPVKIHIVLIV